MMRQNDGPKIRFKIFDRIRMGLRRGGQHVGRGLFGRVPVRGTAAVAAPSKHRTVGDER